MGWLKTSACDTPLRRRHYSGSSLSRALSIEDLRTRALSILPRINAEYVEGGAEDEITLYGNRRGFDRYEFQPRVLRDVARVDTGCMILGQDSQLPFAIAPTGFNGLLWPKGDLALARAASKAGICFGQSTVSNASIADIAAIKPLRHWFQLYLFGQENVWRTLIEEASKNGCETIMLTVDSQVLGNREWDRRNYSVGFSPTLSARLEMLLHPTWMWRVMRHGIPNFPNLAQFVPGQNKDLYTIANWSLANQRPDADWSTVKKIRQAWSGKLIIKGIQHLDDVRAAIDVGADGVVLSNHGGRQLDRAAPPIRLVSSARTLAGKNYTIIVDSGFRRGTEIVLALALGADAVLLGRTMLYGLAVAGEAGVFRAIEILATEIRRTLALLGVSSIKNLSNDCFVEA